MSDKRSQAEKMREFHLKCYRAGFGPKPAPLEEYEEQYDE